MKWFLNLPYKTRIISALVFAAVGFLAIGLTYKYVIEPGIPLWATGKYEVHWSADQLPITVSCETDQSNCKAAVNVWRDATCDKLIEYTSAPNADIRIIEGSANDEERGDAIERTFVSKTAGRINYVNVFVYEPILPYDVRAHAISHGLGLLHTRHGITRPIQTHDGIGERTGPYPRVVDKHARALKERYCAK